MWRAKVESWHETGVFKIMEIRGLVDFRLFRVYGLGAGARAQWTYLVAQMGFGGAAVQGGFRGLGSGSGKWFSV